MSKFSVTLKDPDGPADSIRDAAREDAATVDGLDEEEREALAESREEKFREFAEWKS